MHRFPTANMSKLVLVLAVDIWKHLFPFTVKYLWLTAVENIAWRFPDIRQNDIVLAKPLSVKQEINVMQHTMHQIEFTLTFPNFRRLWVMWAQMN